MLVIYDCRGKTMDCVIIFSCSDNWTIYSVIKLACKQLDILQTYVSLVELSRRIRHTMWENWTSTQFNQFVSKTWIELKRLGSSIEKNTHIIMLSRRLWDYKVAIIIIKLNNLICVVTRVILVVQDDKNGPGDIKVSAYRTDIFNGLL